MLGRAGRIRYSCLKEAARGKQLCKFNGVGIRRKGFEKREWSKEENKEDGFGCSLRGSGREFEARWEIGSRFGGKKGAPRREVVKGTE